MLNEKLVKELSEQRKEPEWLLRKRLDAFDSFSREPMPSFRYGLHIILDPKLDLDKIDFQSTAGKGTDLQGEHMDKLGTLIPKSKFSYLNFSIAKINLIHAKENETLTLELKNKDQFVHTLIIAEKNSSLNVAESIDNTKSKYRSNFVEIFAGRDARVNFASLQNLNAGHYISGKYAFSVENARVNWFDVSLGAEFAKSEVVSFLGGRGAETKNYGLFLGKREQQFDLYASAIHNAEDTKSDILMKGALKDKASGLYRGLVKIGEQAAGSDGYQKEEVLLLSEEAEADAIPNLEIDNENVRCTHGASVGNISKESLFYLMSRGLSRTDSTKLIVEGFFDSMLAKTGSRKFRDIVLGEIR